MSTALDFYTLAQLIGDRAFRETPCPLCSPRRKPANRRKPVLGIWRKAPDFLTYFCAHCQEKGWASDRNAKPIDRRELMRRMREAEERQLNEEAQRRKKARGLWGISQPAAGTIVEAYLRRRGVTVCPPTLRFLPARGDYAPAMLAAFGHPTEPEPGMYELGRAAVHAVHLTRLRPDGSGKAPDAEGRTKIMVGVTESWPIALVPPNDLGGLAIAEGIEDALSLHQATGLGAWAAGAAGRLPKIARHIAGASYIEAVTVAVDDDATGRRYAGELVTELRRRRGRSLEVATIETGEVTHEAA
jgi:hypothetical protein